MRVIDMTPDQAISKAVELLLEHGYKSDYYDSWQEAAKEEYGEDFEEEWYNPEESSAVWDLITDMPHRTPFTADGLSVSIVANEFDGEAVARDEYFLVFKLSDVSGTRYFKRSGWYASYDGGHLEEGENSEVSPQEKLVTTWSSV